MLAMWLCFWGHAEPTLLSSFQIVAAGDTLVHRRVKKTARTKNIINENGVTQNNGGFDWILEDVAPILQQADIAFVNLESPTDPDFHRPIRGEVFNAPVDFLGALSTAGFDVLSFANNHSYDQKSEGLVRTLAEVENREMTAIGAGRSCAEAKKIHIVKVDAIRVGFLAITDLLNINENTDVDTPCVYLPGPKCQKNCTPDRDAIWYHIDENALISDIQTAKRQVDVLILSFHWGIEYRTKPLSLYTALAPKLMEHGVDVLLGHHPHVLQPVVRHTRSNGDEGVIAYSLGNFFSDMGKKYGMYPTSTTRGKTRDGILLSIDIAVYQLENGQRKITIPKLAPIPIWTENANSNDNPQIRVRRHSTILKEDPSRKAFVEKRRQAMSFIEGLSD